MEKKRMEKENWDEQKIEEVLKNSGEREEVPEGLKPENMKKFLEENTGYNRKKNFRKWYGVAAIAACLVLVLFVGRNVWLIQDGMKENVAKEEEQSDDGRMESSFEVAEEEEYDTSYDDLYQFFKKREREKNKTTGFWREDVEVKEETVEDASAAQGGQQIYGSKKDYADTNKQEVGVEEADIIKNDGRYLYQIISNQGDSQSIQIVDTKDGLKETTRIDGFDNIHEFYVWEDTLVIFESCWAETLSETEGEIGAWRYGEEICTDVIRGTAFQKVYVYNIADRENPKEEHVFTMKGSYLDSRVVDGYLYCFLSYYVENLETRKQYENYVPVLEGKAMDASSIYLPTEAQDSAYVVIASIDLRNPAELKDTKAMVSSANRVYVTTSNIYVADSIYSEETKGEGSYSNKTNIVRFSYENGRIQKEAEGSVKGILLDDMAINESNGYLRLAVTVDSYQKKEVKDDIFGFALGYETTNNKRDNSLYVLNENLEIVGKIEGLAEEEQIYSARFMGDIGYFVTFRQTDPLFSVDLSDPKNPKVLGELKISGFSEYLHFYSEDLLLGIGMEADAETGRTEGMKLSMFDISNPADVKEQDKYSLSEYDYSEALYNYKAVMIDTEKNLFGFFAEGWDSSEDGDWREDYLLFSYEDGAFQQKMKISCDEDANGIYVSVRGTYIGEVFYLMYGDGRIEAYRLADGSLLERLTE